MNSIEFTKIAQEISLEEKYTEYICRFIENNPDVLARLERDEGIIKEKLFNDMDSYSSYLKENFSIDLSSLLNLYYAVVFAGQCKEQYIARGIALSIYKDTMADINIWTKTYEKSEGKIGLQQLGWIRNHLLFRIFKLGRLQFEMGHMEQDAREYKKGSDCLHIHIPEGEKLEVEKCLTSLKMAQPFFQKYFSKTYKLAACHSWLLHKNLGQILDKNSNIIKFGHLFEVLENDDDDPQAMERVFGNDITVSGEMPERTTLQKNMKQYLLKGHKIGAGFGIIEFSNLPAS